MTAKILSLAMTLCLITGMTTACATSPASPMPDAQAGASTPGVKAPAPSEFSQGPSTPGGMEKGKATAPSEFSQGPGSGGGVDKGRAPATSEFSQGPK
jgi:hypothetical protein